MIVNNVRCPVCHGTELIEAAYNLAPGGGGGGYWTCIPLGMMSAVKTQRFICKSCGYLMEFFSKPDVMKIENKYGK